MYKIAICDDDKRYRKTIREIVEHENSLHENEIRFYEYESGNELLKHTDILHELVFIDIRMPGLDGNQTALKLRNYNKDAVLIFCSSYFEPTVDSINFGQPFRYIMKDLHDTSLRREIAAIMTEVKRRFLNDYAVTVTSAGKIIRIHVENILYVSRAKRGCVITIVKEQEKETVRCRESFGELCEQLKDQGFAQAHNYLTIENKLFTVLLTLPIATIIIFMCIYYSHISFTGVNRIMIPIGAALLLMTNICIFAVFDKLIERSEEVKKMELLYQKSKAENINQKYINKVNEDKRAFLHDVNKFLCITANLIENGKNLELDNMVRHLGIRIQEMKNYSCCADPVLNSILCERKFVAESKGILYKIKLGNNLRTDFIEDLDLISIVGNLLDNAIEAAEKTEKDKYVICNMYMGNENHFLVMEFRNNYIVPLIKEKERYISTKRDSGSHGIGLHTVKKLVERYGGIMRIVAGEQEFSVEIIFTIK